MEAGLKLNLYDLIQELHVTSGRPPTVNDIAERDTLDVKATERLLNAIVAFEILMKQGRIRCNIDSLIQNESYISG